MACRRPVQPSAEHLASICQPEDVAECVMLVALLNPRARYTCRAQLFLQQKSKATSRAFSSRLARRFFLSRSLGIYLCVCGCAAFRSWLSSRPSNSTQLDGRRTADAQHYSCVWNGQMHRYYIKGFSPFICSAAAFAQQAGRVFSLCTSTWWRSGWTATQSATATGSGTCTTSNQAHPSVT